MTAAASGRSALRLRQRTDLVPAGEALILRLGPRVLKVRSDDEIVRCLHVLHGGATPAGLAGTIGSEFGPAAAEKALQLLQVLDARGFIESVDPPADLHPADLARFDRFLNFLSEFETDAQSRYAALGRLRAAHVAMVGTGGLGSWILLNLACCGVGRLTLFDGDTVELHNLNRSVLFDEGDVGRPKLEAVRDRLLRFAPRTEITLVPGYVAGPEDVARHLGDVDVLVGAADEPLWLIRQWMAEAAAASGVAMITGQGGQVGPFFVPGQSACIMCYWRWLEARTPQLAEMVATMRTLPKRSTGGVSPVAAISGGVIGLDILRHLVGHEVPVTRNRVWRLGSDLRSELVDVEASPTCPVCVLPTATPSTHGSPLVTPRR